MKDPTDTHATKTRSTDARNDALAADEAPAPDVVWRGIHSLLDLSMEDIAPSTIEKALDLKFPPPEAFERSPEGPARIVYKTMAGATRDFNVFYIDAAPGVRSFHFDWAATPAVQVDAKHCVQIKAAEEDLLLNGWKKTREWRAERTPMNMYSKGRTDMNLFFQRNGCLVSISLYFHPKEAR